VPARVQYLAHTPLETLSDAEKRQLAVDVALAALVGEGVFNFGEIIEHPVMASLAATPEAWLADLLRVFHTGDIDQFTLVVSTNSAAYHSQVTFSVVVACVCVAVCASLHRVLTWRRRSSLDVVLWCAACAGSV
jgi:hypothetical protein